MATYTVNTAGFTPAQVAAVNAAAKLAAPGNSVNVVSSPAPSSGGGGSSAPAPAPAPAPVAPITIDSSLSAADQAAVKNAYITGGGSPNNVSYSAPATVVPAPAPAVQPKVAAPAPAATTAAPQGQPAASGAPSGTAAPTIQAPTIALQPGATGAAVKQLQDYLVSQGLMTQAAVNTGYGTYGPQTQAAVAALQNKLGVDNSSGVGYYGPHTMAAIQSALQKTQPVTQPQDGTGTNPSGLTTPAETTTSDTSGASSSSANDPYAGMDPIQKQVQMYTEAYNSLGLSTIKQQFDDYVKQQNDLTNKMNDELQAAQNNPWLSQPIVDRTQAQIKKKYDLQLNTLTNLITLTDSMYKQGVAQVETIVSKANADIAATNALAQKQLDAAAAIAKDNVVQSVGGRELLVNKVSGKTVADLGPTTPSASSTADFSLSPGQTRFDAQGNPIASVAPKPAAAKGTGGTSNSIAPKQVTAMKNALNASKFQGAEADGKYADPNLYLQNYTSWKDSGGDPSVFLKTFPPATYINPANTWLPKEIMQFTKKSSAGNVASGVSLY